MRSLLAGLTPADIRTDPFPHIVADRPMDTALYDALSASFPPFQRMAWDCPPDLIPSNRRFELPAWLIMESPDLPACWKAFVASHSDPGFLAQVETLFQGHWPAALLDALGGRLTGHDTGRLHLADPGPHRIHQDARLEINTPVRDRPSSSRSAHLDRPNRLYSGLFYMRAPDDDSEGGDLLLYRWKEGPVDRLDRYELPADAVEVAATIPYRANRLVIFPQGINALHGVSPRHPTPHTRRYVFLTAELPEGEDWLRGPNHPTPDPPA